MNRSGSTKSKKRLTELTAVLDRARLIIVDEDSMLGFEGLAELINQITKNRTNTDLLPIVLCGDRYQLDPVQKTPFWKPQVRSEDIKAREGYQLYHGLFTICLFLSVNMRQESDPDYKDLIQAVLEERLEERHLVMFQQMKERMATAPPTSFAPVAVAYHETRRLYYARAVVDAALMHAQLPDQNPPVVELQGHWSPPRGVDPGSREWRELQTHLLSANLNGRESPALYLWVGAHVMFSENENLKAGVVNAATGVVVGFLTADGEAPNYQQVQRVIGNHQVTLLQPMEPIVYILVKITNPEARARKLNYPLGGLPDDVWPLAAKSNSESVKVGQHTVSGSFKQFNLLACDAMTIHKLQGATVSTGLRVHSLCERSAGNNHTMSLSHIYVVLTRCTSLRNLYLHHCPTLEEIQRWRWPPALKQEVERLRQLAEQIRASLVLLE